SVVARTRQGIDAGSGCPPEQKPGGGGSRVIVARCSFRVRCNRGKECVLKQLVFDAASADGIGRSPRRGGRLARGGEVAAVRDQRWPGGAGRNGGRPGRGRHG